MIVLTWEIVRLASRPGDDGQLLVVDHEDEPSILAEGQVRPTRLTIPASEAVAAFGRPKPVGSGWFGKRVSPP